MPVLIERKVRVTLKVSGKWNAESLEERGKLLTSVRELLPSARLVDNGSSLSVIETSDDVNIGIRELVEELENLMSRSGEGERQRHISFEFAPAGEKTDDDIFEIGR